MVISSILQGFSALNSRATGRCQDVLEGTGLHLADPDRLINCPFLRATGAPVIVIEGFRFGRYTGSALFSESIHEIVTVIECGLPPFSCRVENGIPRMIRSLIALPLKPLERMGDSELAGDGRCVHCRKTFRTGTPKRILSIQLREIENLERLIDSMHTPGN